MTKPNLVIYHQNCIDGIVAAGIAYSALGDTADYVPMQYGTVPDIASMAGRHVYILDFSFSREVCEQIHSVALYLVILDHHRTAQAALAGLPYAMFDMTVSGAMLAWRYWYPADEPSKLVRYVSDYDIWNHHTSDIKALNQGLRTMPMDVPTFSDLAMNGDYSNLANLLIKGYAILEYTDRQVESISRYAMPSDIGGHRGLIINASSVFTSALGHMLAEQSGTYGAVFTMASDGKMIVSLRSIGEYDVSEIARSHGGGGHLNAAAFTVPWTSLTHQDGLVVVTRE
jgi:oligoribonuclease NrnB/cAMP/cGMP phosphodiesterase (DHH superfamily)